jgi:hypothetical protein
MTTQTLPAEFREMEPLVAEWALTNERDRLAKLIATSIPELKNFYDAMIGRAEAARDYLSALPIDALPPEAKNLFHLLMTFVETAHPIELKWSITDIDDAFPLSRITFGPASTTSPI